MNENNDGRVRNWFRGLQDEFRKITWLDQPTLWKQVLAVIIVTVIVAIIIVVVDMGIQYGVEALTKL